MRPDSEAGFSIGVYHTGQPPMLEVKGKGGIPSMEAGAKEWIDHEVKRCDLKIRMLYSSLRSPDWQVSPQGCRPS